MFNLQTEKRIMKLNKILGLALAAVALTGFTSCQTDEPDTSYSVITTKNAKPTQLDLWLTQNFRQPYNIDFKYRYEDVEGDFNYYLVPCRYDDAITMAHLVKHLCIETYNETAGTDFTCRYFPKMFYLVGEWEYRNNGTFILGTAEGGRKIFLAGLNYLQSSLKDVEQLNEYYFKTIHHEFTHILNQTKSIPADYQLVTGDAYVADSWSTAPYNAEYLQNGFISAYAQMSYTEDFAEMLSIYITNPKEVWDERVGSAPAEAQGKINAKLDIVREYMATNFNIDIDVLRDVLQRRQREVINGDVDLTSLSIDQ